MTGLRRTRAILGMDRGDFPTVIVRSKATKNGLSAHPELFTEPPIELAIFGSQIADLEAAELAMHTRVSGAAALRIAKRDIVWTSLEAYRAYVQGRADANPEQALIIIGAAGFKVAGSTSASKPVLDAWAEGHGRVALSACAKLLYKGQGARFYNWQSSIDNGATWVDAPSTPLTKTSISGLPPLTTCLFRVSVTHGGGQQPWSQAVSALVL